MLKRCLAISLLLIICLPALAKPKKKTYDNSSDDVFNAALRTARERHVVTYVNEKIDVYLSNRALIFQSGVCRQCVH